MTIYFLARRVKGRASSLTVRSARGRHPGAARWKAWRLDRGLSAFVAAACLLLFVVPVAQASFGFLPGGEGFGVSIVNRDGTPDVQAGSHPYELVTTLGFNRTGGAPDGDLKNAAVELPPGLIGDTNVIPQCDSKDFSTQAPGPRQESSYLLSGSDCPANTQVGVARVEVSLYRHSQVVQFSFGIFNLVPPPGVPAEFGFSADKIQVLLRPTVRTGGDYGLTVSSRNTEEETAVLGVRTSFWGVPEDPSHDGVRGECLGLEGESLGSCSTETPVQAFLTLPASCSGVPLVFAARIDSWEEPGALKEENPVNPLGVADLSDPRWKSREVSFGPLRGCEQPAFGPTIKVAPDTTASDTPAGLTADVQDDQSGLVNPQGIAASALKDTTVVLPAGMTINPGQANGLEACQSYQDAVGSEGEPSCPLASKVGTASITTPLLADKVEGNVYVLQSDPPHLQLLVNAVADGVDLKLVGDIHLNEATGQLTAVFPETPPLPFTDFKLSFSGGAQAALVTPPTCATYTAGIDFVPWSTPFTLDFPTTSSFAITTGPDGSGPAGCVGPLPFAPVMTAGSSTDQAGGFTNFSLLLARGDGQQRISSLQFKAPPGLSGMISQVPLCGEPQASEGTCPASSQIGHTVVTAGPGPYPLVVPGPGQPPAPIYLTGPYRGAPFGLSIAVPVIAGPFDLGTRVVRASIAVDPQTAQLTITTDPSGPYAIPTVLDGIPTDLRDINAVVDRPGFMFNPTNCSPQSFSGIASSSEGSTAVISSHFQVGSCSGLAFKPDFKVSTQGKTSRSNGASLDARIVYSTSTPADNQASSQANIASVKVELPKQLPSRLTTLQKACVAKVFEGNPASCPRASIVGTARVITPLLPVPLAGPAYFVSHGGEAFPSLIVVLQGYGVTVEVLGTTFISKRGITSTTFKAVPDVPFSTFELKLPEGPFSALAANGNLCTSKLVMPTLFTAQNGAVSKQSTKIALTGCPKAKKASKPRHKSKASDASRAAQRNAKDGSSVHAKGAPSAANRDREDGSSVAHHNTRKGR